VLVKLNANPKGICFDCSEDGHWMRNCPKYLAFKHSGKVFVFWLYTCFSKNPLEFLVCGFDTNTCLQYDCRGSRKLENQEKKRQTLKFEDGMKIPWMSFC
jgi:hypothetical protein